MTDFFGGLTGSNIRFTDARIDGDGPLPTSLSGPEGINGDPDGRYNFNVSLLSGITPYAYGQGRMGSDRNYQQRDQNHSSDLQHATLEFWVRFPNERNQGKQAHPVLKYRVPDGSHPRVH
jgi:hypothetical protein